jgi:hypothetical protein
MFWNLERVKKIRPLYRTHNMKFSRSLTWPGDWRCFLTWLTSIFLPSSVTNNSLQWPLQLHTFPTKCKWLGLMTQLPITFHFYNPASQKKMWNRPKKLNAISTKGCCGFFPQSAPCPVCFYLLIPKHDLGPCYACFGHAMGIRDL